MLSLHQRHVLTIVKKLVKQQYLLDVSSEYGKLRCTNRRLRGRLWSLGHRSKFQRLSRMAMLLQWRCSPEANQTLHDVWLSPGLVHCIYISGAFSLWLNLARLKIHFACLSCVLLFWQHYCTALEQWASATHFWHGTTYKEWNYGSFAQGATYIRLCGHHVRYRPTFWFHYILWPGHPME